MMLTLCSAPDPFILSSLDAAAEALVSHGAHDPQRRRLRKLFPPRRVAGVSALSFGFDRRASGRRTNGAAFRGTAPQRPPSLRTFGRRIAERIEEGRIQIAFQLGLLTDQTLPMEGSSTVGVQRFVL